MLTIKETVEQLKNGAVTSKALVEKSIKTFEADKNSELPLNAFLEIYDDVDALMFNFEYECNIDQLPPEFQNCVFNFISTEEFVDYLRDRYPRYSYDEVTTYKINKRS